MPPSVATLPNEPFDWLADRSPLLAAQQCWADGSYQEPAFLHLHYDPKGPFSIACGAGLLAEHIRRFRISPEVIGRLGQITTPNGQCIFQESFLNHLQRLRLRVRVNAAPEGMLLLPDEPLLTVQGPLLQLRLLTSAFRLLLWESTHWATQAAWQRWKNDALTEEDTPSAPATPFNAQGWKIRAAYIGGASADDILAAVPQSAPEFPAGAFEQIQHRNGNPLLQIRRLFRGAQALGDLWLTPEQEERASVSRTSTRLAHLATGAVTPISMTRFQNLYQPVLVKGHPVLAPTRLAYLRQRTLKQMQAFRQVDVAQYPHGWLVD